MMLWDKIIFNRRFNDGRVIPLDMGIRLSVDDMFVYHRELKDRFQFVMVDVNNLNTLEKQQFFKKFADTYNIIVESPGYINVYNRKDESFAKSIAYAQQMLTLSEDKIYGFVISLDRFYSINRDVAFNTLENIYLKRVKPLYERIHKKLVLMNTHRGPLVQDVFPLSLSLKIARETKGIDLGLDMLTSHLLGANFMADEHRLAVSSLSKDYHMLILSGIGKQNSKTSIRTCTKFKSGSYVELVKTFKRSIIILDADSTRDSIEDWKYLEKYLGRKKSSYGL